MIDTPLTLSETLPNIVQRLVGTVTITEFGPEANPAGTSVAFDRFDPSRTKAPTEAATPEGCPVKLTVPWPSVVRVAVDVPFVYRIVTSLFGTPRPLRASTTVTFT